MTLRSFLLAVAISATSLFAPASPASTSTPVGVWTNVTPAGMNLSPNFGGTNNNYGVQVVVVDPARQSDLYASIDYQGIWKSTDYGVNWSKISTGTNGTVLDFGRPWALAIDTNKARNPATAPTLWTVSGYGTQTGIFKSIDGGVNWVKTSFPYFADGYLNGQDPYSLEVDPYDGTHLITGFHGTSEAAESIDGGSTWKIVPTPPGVGTSLYLFFIDTGVAATTRTNWVSISQWTSNTKGVWHTSNGGASWTQAATFEHFHGNSQLFNAGNSVAYIGATGGVYKTADGGATWSNILGGNKNGVVGTPSTLYTSFGWATNGSWGAALAHAAVSNDKTWITDPIPATMSNGAKHTAVTFDGMNYVIVSPNGLAGLWRFVEVASAPPPAVSVSISPNIIAGAALQFSALVSGSSDTTVNWVLQEGPVCGAVSSGGQYTAPLMVPNPATCHVVATSRADATKTASVSVTVTASASVGGLGPPALQITGGMLLDPHGNKVILRGVATMGMGMVYGDKANPGTYLPMTVPQYVHLASQTDATGNKWYPTAIRLAFERFPCVDPKRLYTIENRPYAMPDTVTFSAWMANAVSIEGAVATFGGSRYRAVKINWRADRGAAWNLGTYALGDVVSGYGNGNDMHLYRNTFASGAGPSYTWNGGPSGTSLTVPSTDAMSNQWLYIGEFGTSGSTQPFTGATVTDYSVGAVYPDNFLWWQYMSIDYTPAQALSNFNDWKSKVMDPAIQAAVDAKLYVVVTDFDFGPAQHPLRHARMLDFWSRMARSQWANHPQVIFELWNESEDVGPYAGGSGSWAVQKPIIQETVNAIRAAGANNIVVVPTPFYSAWVGEATASPLTGTNLAYALHAYRSQWESYSSNRDQISQGLASGQAVMMTEWGDNTDPSSATNTWATTTSTPPSLRQLLEPSEGSLHPPIGWFAWAQTQTWSPDLFSDAALTQPTNFGTATRQWLLDKRLDSQPVP